MKYPPRNSSFIFCGYWIVEIITYHVIMHVVIITHEVMWDLAD